MNPPRRYAFFAALLFLLASALLPSCGESQYVMSRPLPPSHERIPPPEMPVPASTTNELIIIPLDSPLPAQAHPTATSPPTLLAKQPWGATPFPLIHTDISADITGFIASVAVTQQYSNPFSQKMDAVYTFPLPADASINAFVLSIGDRRIRGIIRARPEAEKIYAQARAQGFLAVLLDQNNDNRFTQNIANLQPGKSIDVAIRYFHTVVYADGWFQWSIPLPPLSPVNANPSAPQALPTSLAINLDPGLPIRDLTASHKIHRDDSPRHSTHIDLDPVTPNPTGEFTLRYQLAGDATASALFYQPATQSYDGYFAAMILPPQHPTPPPRVPSEHTFILDVSPAMTGPPLAQAQVALNVALAQLKPDDTFQIIRCAEGYDQLASLPIPATPENVASARQFITRPLSAHPSPLPDIATALISPPAGKRARFLIFLTAGQLGPDALVLQSLHAALPQSHTLVLAFSPDPNLPLLQAIARIGCGRLIIVAFNDDPAPLITASLDQLTRPVLSNVAIDLTNQPARPNVGDRYVIDLHPAKLPDLAVDHPIFITGRCSIPPPDHLVLTATQAGRSIQITIPFASSMTFIPPASALSSVPFPMSPDRYALSTIWARMKIADLHQQSLSSSQDLSADLSPIALTYGLVSEFTSFIAVDTTSPTQPTP